MSASAAAASALIASAEEGIHPRFRDKTDLQRNEKIAKEDMREAILAHKLMGREVIALIIKPSADSLQPTKTPIDIGTRIAGSRQRNHCDEQPTQQRAEAGSG